MTIIVKNVYTEKQYEVKKMDHTKKLKITYSQNTMQYMILTKKQEKLHFTCMVNNQDKKSSYQQ